MARYETALPVLFSTTIRIIVIFASNFMKFKSLKSNQLNSVHSYYPDQQGSPNNDGSKLAVY